MNGTAEVGADDGRIEALHEASALAARRAHEMLNELVAERALREQAEERVAEAQAAVAAERARAEEAEAVARRLREVHAQREAEFESRLAAAEAPDDEVAGPGWNFGAQRALTAALAQANDWREGVKAAIGIIGTAGGWDAICVWRLEDGQPWISCFAMWTADQHQLREFETATWQRRQPLSGSSIGQAFISSGTRWMATDLEAEDRRLQVLAHHGMRGALIAVAPDGARPVAALELLTMNPQAPSAELTASIEAVALQLGDFWHLLSTGAQPKWRFGRM